MSFVLIIAAFPLQAGKDIIRRELRQSRRIHLQEAQYQSKLRATFQEPFDIAPSVTVKPGTASTLIFLLLLTSQSIDAVSRLENETARNLPKSNPPRPPSSTTKPAFAGNSTSGFASSSECIGSLPSQACWAAEMVQAYEMKMHTHEITKSFAQARSPTPVHVAVLDVDFDETLVEHFQSNGTLPVKSFHQSQTTKASSSGVAHGTSVTSMVAAKGPVGMVQEGIALTYYHQANALSLDYDAQLDAICDDLFDPDGIVIINRSSNEWVDLPSDSGILRQRISISHKTLLSLSSKGCLVITSAGNFGQHLALEGDIADANLIIEAVDSRRAIADFSDSGELYAPGAQVLAMIPSNSASMPAYASLSGTSFAAPIVTGIATNVVNILKNQPEAFFQQLKPQERIELVNRILEHAHVRGVINGYKAVELAYRWTEASKEISSPVPAKTISRIAAFSLCDFTNTSVCKAKHAIFRNDAHTIRVLLERELTGNDVLREDRFRDNLISYAIFHGRLEIVKLLLDAAKPYLTLPFVEELITHTLRLNLPFVFKLLLENSRDLFVDNEQANFFWEIINKKGAKLPPPACDVFVRLILSHNIKATSSTDVVDGIKLLLDRQLYSSAYFLIGRADANSLTGKIEGNPAESPLLLAIQNELSSHAMLILNRVDRDVFTRRSALMIAYMELAALHSMWSTVTQFAKRIRFSKDELRGMMNKLVTHSGSRYFAHSQLLDIVVERLDPAIITDELIEEAVTQGLTKAAVRLRARRTSALLPK